MLYARAYIYIYTARNEINEHLLYFVALWAKRPLRVAHRDGMHWGAQTSPVLMRISFSVRNMHTLSYADGHGGLC